MSLWKIAWRSIQQRGWASLLTIFSMSLGVMLVSAVLSIHGVVSESFRGNAGLGYNMIVGAKGGRLQLTLNTVYYLSEPVENIPYDYYLEFLTEERRLQEQADAGDLDLKRDGEFGEWVELAIPVCLGDYYSRFRLVGTTPDFLNQLTYGPSSDRHFEFSAGENFKHKDDKCGYFGAVVGATVARVENIQVGDVLAPTHGSIEGKRHGETFTVLGILKPTGTPNDRAVFINMEGFYLMEGHAKPVKTEDGQPAPPEEYEMLPIAQREVTAILVKSSMRVSRAMSVKINEGNQAQAVSPISEIYNLFDLIVGPIQNVLILLTVMICVVSGISIWVSIYNSMSERRKEIAVMRALGAKRPTIMMIILLESVLLALSGGLIGWFAAHASIAAVSPMIAERTGVSLGFWDMAPAVSLQELLWMEPTLPWLKVSTELLLIPGLILLAIAVGFAPAMSAYRTDVAKALAD